MKFPVALLTSLLTSVGKYSYCLQGEGEDAFVYSTTSKVPNFGSHPSRRGIFGLAIVSFHRHYHTHSCCLFLVYTTAAFAPSTRWGATATSSSSRLQATIESVAAREILDSRGNPTVEVEVTTQQGLFRASVPSGASTGAYEAVELRDGGDRYLGKGVLNAVQNVKEILGPAVIGMNPVDQQAIDDLMLDLDGTPNKAKLGANAILGVSLAVAKAGAAANNVPLWKHFADLAGNDLDQVTMPVPCFNVINGGSHAGNKLAFQEYFVIPTGAKSFAEAMQSKYNVSQNTANKRRSNILTLAFGFLSWL